MYGCKTRQAAIGFHNASRISRTLDAPKLNAICRPRGSHFESTPEAKSILQHRALYIKCFCKFHPPALRFEMPSAILITHHGHIRYQVRPHPPPACISGRLTQKPLTTSDSAIPGSFKAISAATPTHRRQHGLLNESRHPIPCQPAIHGHLQSATSTKIRAGF